MDKMRPQPAPERIHFSCLYCGETHEISEAEEHLMNRHGFPAPPPKERHKKMVQPILPELEGFRRKFQMD